MSHTQLTNANLEIKCHLFLPLLMRSFWNKSFQGERLFNGTNQLLGVIIVLSKLIYCDEIDWKQSVVCQVSKRWFRQGSLLWVIHKLWVLKSGKNMYCKSKWCHTRLHGFLRIINNGYCATLYCKFRLHWEGY